MNPGNNGDNVIMYGPTEEVAITGIHLLPGVKGPSVKVLVYVSDATGASNVRWFDLQPDEKAAVISLARQIEERLLEEVRQA